MAEHTKGPWRTFNGTDVYPDDGDTEGARHIADCSMAGSIGADEQRANALLIAASPELMKALKAILDGVFVSLCHSRDLDYARYVIAKAEGGRRD